MFSILKKISTKNKLWSLVVAIILFISSYSLIIINNSEITQIQRIVACSSILATTIVALIIHKILIHKFILKLNECSILMSQNCEQGDKALVSLNEDLTEFIKHSGSQIDELNESANLMRTISDMLFETTRNSDVSKEMSDKVTRDINEGNDIMQQMVEAILTIEKTKNGLSEISGLIKQISNDTSTIHNIVSTTELLSLNASIEAARAGQAGRGFSVVAEEVGNLAKHSGHEANEIEEIVEKSQKQIQKIIDANQERAEIGKITSQKALEVFSSLKSEMFGISSRSENIRAATWEQKIGIDQLSQGNIEIRNILKKNITDTVDLMRIYNANVKNFSNIKEIGNVLNEYWAGVKKDGNE